MTEPKFLDGPPGLSYRSPKTAVGPSSIQGRGLFATAPFLEGEIVAVKGGYILDPTALAAVTRELGPVEIQVAEDLSIAPVARAEVEGAMIFSNHSCEPNIGVQGQIVFVAMRDIAAGEELTHDWCTTDDGDYEMRCRCGKGRCRGVVTGRDWRDPELQERYHGWFAWHIQRRIEAGV